MTLKQMLRRAADAALKAPTYLKEWREQVRREHADRNMAVRTRQVARRRFFFDAFARVSQDFGGELRFRRRGMARVLAKRKWSDFRKVAA